MGRLASTLLAVRALTTPAIAQSNYPSRPVMTVVPFAAGPLDIVARIVVEAMSRELGQNFLIENASGAGGTIGATCVARASPDGYTISMYHIGLATSPALYWASLIPWALLISNQHTVQPVQCPPSWRPSLIVRGRDGQRRATVRLRRVPISALAARVKRELNPPVILCRLAQQNCGESRRFAYYTGE